MTKHYNCSDDQAMNAIADWIEGNKTPFQEEEDSNEEDCVYILEKLQPNYKVAFIHPRGVSKSLYKILDSDSRERNFNLLIWEESDNDVTVVHFGPFGQRKERFFNEMKKLFEKLYKIDFKRLFNTNNFWKKWKELINSKKKTYQDSILESEKRLFALVGATLGEKSLNLLIQAGYFIEHQANGFGEVLIKIAAKESWSLVAKYGGEILAKQALGQFGKIAAKEGVELVAKQGGKEVAKQAGKTGAKAVPVVGLVMGLGFGAWRLIKGEPELALFEVASGAASCVPGVGTGISIGNIHQEFSNETCLLQVLMLHWLPMILRR